MNYFNANNYEMKRKIVNFSKIMSRGLKKPEQKFIGDMIYGISAAKDIKISNIAKTLKETIKLDNVIERLCLHLNKIKDKDKVTENYYKFVQCCRAVFPQGRPEAILFRLASSLITLYRFMAILSIKQSDKGQCKRPRISRQRKGPEQGWSLCSAFFG